MTIHFADSPPSSCGHLIPVNPEFTREAQVREYWPGYSAEWLSRHLPKAGDHLSLFTADGQPLVLVRLEPDTPFGKVLSLGRQIGFRLRRQMPSSLAIHWTNDLPASQLEALTNGLRLATYRIGRFRTQEEENNSQGSGVENLYITEVEERHELREALQRALAIAATQLRIFDLVNAPSNHKKPSELARWARESGEKYGYRVQTWDKERIEQEGLHALLAVNRGSEDPPAFLIMEYRGDNSPERPTVIVGKGVTFDTGGLSIKPSANMHLMKSDMGGAAAVLGTVEAAARLQLPIHLVGIVPATDNSVDARSIKPGDVISSYSGKTIEIIDTDAEGRLILADGLAYAVKHYDPATLIDLATLTGSSVRTLGYAAAALFTDDDDLARQLSDTGMETGEKVWRLPLWDEYMDDMRSDVADIRNFSGKPIAGAITAAKFLQSFTGKHPRWAHLDIAGVALTASEYSKDRSATAWGIRLLLAFLQAEVKSQG